MFDGAAFFLDLFLYFCYILYMIIDWNIDQIKNEIRKITFAGTDPRMDGFVTWRCKQDLYKLLWHIEDELEQCSTYADEEEFLKERDKEVLWKTLKKNPLDK